MKIINYYNFSEKLLNKYNRYFLLGKEISLINDIEESIIQYLNSNNFIKIYRVDLNLKLNIYEFKKNILVKDLFDSINLIILRAEEIWLHSSSHKSVILLLHKIIPINYFLIVKTHILQKDISTNLLSKNKIFLSMKPLIIKCKIDNYLNEVKSWLELRTKCLNFTLSPIIYKYLYSCYENNVEKLLQIIKNLYIKKNNYIMRLIDFHKILLKHDISFNLHHILKYLYKGDLYILWYKLFSLIYNNKQDQLISIFYEFKFFIIKLTKLLIISKYKQNKNNIFLNYIKDNKTQDNLQKIIKLINLKKLYLIIKILNKLEVDLTFLSYKEKSNLIYEKIIHITILICML